MILMTKWNQSRITEKEFFPQLANGSSQQLQKVQLTIDIISNPNTASSGSTMKHSGTQTTWRRSTNGVNPNTATNPQKQKANPHGSPPLERRNLPKKPKQTPSTTAERIAKTEHSGNKKSGREDVRMLSEHRCRSYTTTPHKSLH